jgi:HAD superfamily hydrolase (TIGR01509 family)
MENLLEWFKRSVYMIQGVIFDVDGTLFDSLSMWERVDQLYLDRKGVKVTPEISRQLFHLPLEKGALFIKNKFHLKEDVDTIMKEIMHISRDMYLNEVPVKKGVLSVLNYFQEKHIPMTVATSNNKELVKAAFHRHHMGHYFKEILTSDEIGRGKNEPDIYLKACQQMHVSPENTLVFEDALHALKTVKTAGFRSVGCFDAYSIQDQPQIKRLADHYVVEMDEILKEIKE